MTAALRLAACFVTRPVNSCLCRTDKSVSLCWRARWYRIRTGCCWTSSTMGSTPIIGGASTRCSMPPGAEASLGWRLRIGRATCREAPSACWNLRQGRVHASSAFVHRTWRVCGAGGESRAPRRAARGCTAAARGRAQRRRAVERAAVLRGLSQVDLYVDYRPVLRDLDWQLRRGEHWAVYGANGAGKSSFLKLLYGDLSPALGGRIERARISQRYTHRGVEAASRLCLAGTAERLRGATSVCSDLVASGRYASIGLVDEATAEDLRAAAHWLRFFGLLSVAERRPRELSYGQLRRALIARAMAADARILLLDEPLTGLDPAQRAIMKRLLERLMKQLTLIVAVHHAGRSAARHDARFAFT